MSRPPWEAHLDNIAVGCKTENWDSYGAKPVTDVALNAALNLGRSLMVSPCNDGGIQISLAGEALAFEIGPDGAVTNVYADVRGTADFLLGAPAEYGEER